MHALNSQHLRADNMKRNKSRRAQKKGIAEHDPSRETTKKKQQDEITTQTYSKQCNEQTNLKLSVGCAGKCVCTVSSGDTATSNNNNSAMHVRANNTQPLLLHIFQEHLLATHIKINANVQRRTIS